MEVSRKLQRGKIDISMNAIAAIAGNAALECYGVLGMASKRKIIDGVAELLQDDSYAKGVFAISTSKGVEINMYIVCAYGVKITEVVSEVQKKVRYVLKKTLDIDFSAINVYVQGIKNIE
ncbi:MAG: Asp23/Gls24 family envelope stress response protein [Bacilli bacterium]|jgi:uncharacterized alkaline shock family protein YloU|nr:Asp23/Gls24 family envelope stress response protein [Bacilli bacterium]MDD3422421.1 Asp23/Gls24 family envelope stress response protein [Bacilli bacterium]MDD4065751.1 Asp23/Gls24 family envelope stress response protein [Bacilli bacterium]